MFSLNVENTQPEILLLTSPDGGYVGEVEALRVFYNVFVERENFARKEVGRSAMMYIHGAPQKITSPMCCVDRLEYGRKLNNSGVNLCLL